MDDFNTGGKSFPQLPRWYHEDVALVLTLSELIAIEEAELILGLLFDAGPSNIRKQQEALDLYYGDDPDLYDPAKYIAKELQAIRDKIDHALRGHKRVLREHRLEVETWMREHPHS